MGYYSVMKMKLSYFQENGWNWKSLFCVIYAKIGKNIALFAHMQNLDLKNYYDMSVKGGLFGEGTSRWEKKKSRR
jgi:hypothetical protein